jgi:hypothetical protein
LPTVDDTVAPWANAIEERTNNQSPWVTVVIPSALGGSFENSAWIYTAEGDLTTSEPAGAIRGLRKTIQSGDCKCGTCAQVVITS